MDNPVEPYDDPSQSFYSTSLLLLPDVLPYTDKSSVYHSKLGNARNLLVTSNVYGYTFLVNSTSTNKLYYSHTNELLQYLQKQHAANQSDDDTAKDPILLNDKILHTYALSSSTDVINYLVLSHDNNVLAVVRDRSIELIYLYTLNKPQQPLQHTHSSIIVDLKFHTTTYNQFIVLDIDNTVTLYLIGDNGVSKLYTYSDASIYAICWQPDESIVLLSSDSIIQCNNMLKPQEYIDLIQDDELVDFRPHHISQLDNDNYLIGYSELNEDNALLDPLRVCMVVQNITNESITMLGDILNDENRLQSDDKLYEARYYNRLIQIKQWHMNLLSSNKCSELAVIGRTDNNEYRQYMVGDGTAIPSVPLDPSYNDTYPLGVAIDTTNTIPPITKNGQFSTDSTPLPAILILTTDARIAVYSYHAEQLNNRDVMRTVAPLPSSLPSAAATTQKSTTESKPTEISKPASTQPTATNAFAAAQPKGGWNCEICEVNNPDTVTECRSCEAPKPGASVKLGSNNNTQSSGFTFGSSQPITTPAFTFGTPSTTSATDKIAVGTTTTTSKPFNAFAAAQPKGGWNCSECDSNNPDGTVQCRSCEAMKLGAEPIKQSVPVSAFTFGVSNNNSNSTSTFTPSTTFGSLAPVTSGGFPFGKPVDSASSTTAQSTASTPSFSFDTPSSSSAATTCFSFGSSSTSTSNDSKSTTFNFNNNTSNMKTDTTIQSKPISTTGISTTNQTAKPQLPIHQSNNNTSVKPTATTALSKPQSTIQFPALSQQATAKDKQQIQALSHVRQLAIQPSDFDTTVKPDETELHFRLALKQTALEIEQLRQLRTDSYNAIQSCIDNKPLDSLPTLDITHMHTLLLHTNTLLDKCKQLQDELYSSNNNIQQQLQSLTASIAQCVHDAEYSKTILKQQTDNEQSQQLITSQALDPQSKRLHNRIVTTAKTLNEQIQLLERYVNTVHSELKDKSSAVQNNEIHTLEQLYNTINEHAQQLKHIKHVIHRIRTELHDTPLLTIPASEQLLLTEGSTNNDLSFDDAELIDKHDVPDTDTAIVSAKQSLLSVDTARQIAQAFGNKLKLRQEQTTDNDVPQLLTDVDNVEAERAQLPKLNFNTLKSTPNTKQWQRTSRNKFTSPNATINIQSPVKSTTTPQTQSTRKFVAPVETTSTTVKSPDIPKFSLSSASKQSNNVLSSKPPTVAKPAASKPESVKTVLSKSDSKTTDTGKQLSFNFGGSDDKSKPDTTDKSATTSTFTFPSLSDKSSDKKSDEQKSSTPSFTFPSSSDKTTQSKAAEKTTTSFSFATATINNTATSKPGTDEEKTESDKPATTFSFGDTSKPSTSAFSFGSSDAKSGESQAAPTTFSFGSSSSSTSSSATPSFSFPSLDSSKPSTDNKTEPVIDGAKQSTATTSTTSTFTFPTATQSSTTASISESKSSSSELGGFGGLSFGTTTSSNDKPNPFSFSFGDNKTADSSTTASAFTPAAAPANPFGSIFGTAKAAPQPTATPSTSFSSPQQSAFGSSGTTFGQSTAATPSFGSGVTFGSTDTTAQPTFGQSSAFGAQQPSFGTFGASRTLGISGFGTQQPVFGSSTFGTPTHPAAQPPQQQATPTKTFGSGFTSNQGSGFGALANQAPTSGFAAFGQSQTQAPQSSPFGQVAQSAGGFGSGFGASATPPFPTNTAAFGNIRM